MNTELERALHETAPELTLDTAAKDVLARGDRLRRRRRRGYALGVSGLAAATVCAVAVTGGQPDGGAPGDGPATSQFQVASWSGPTTNLSAGQLADVRAACAGAAEDARDAGLSEPGWDLAGRTVPAAAEVRDGLVLTYFDEGRDYLTCAVELGGAGAPRIVAQSAGVEKALPADRHVALVTAGTADPGPMGGPLSGVYAVVRASADVDSLELVVAGETYTGTADGLGFFWLPDGQLTQTDLDAATITAVDADGNVLQRSGRGEVW